MTWAFKVMLLSIGQMTWALQKILGASFSDLRNLVRLEFGALGFFSAILGVSLSSAASFLLSHFILTEFGALSSYTQFAALGTNLTEESNQQL